MPRTAAEHGGTSPNEGRIMYLPLIAIGALIVVLRLAVYADRHPHRAPHALMAIAAVVSAAAALAGKL